MIESARIRQLLLFILLAVSSYAVFDKYFNVNDKELFQPFTKGYAITGVSIETTDENGQILSTIKSPSVIHYADTEKTIIEQPDVTLHEADGDWEFKSSVGEINAEKTEIFFPNEVLVNLKDLENTENKKALAINTSALTVDMANKMGRTSNELLMEQIGSMMKGVGAVVDFNQQNIELLSEMYAEFEN